MSALRSPSRHGASRPRCAYLVLASSKYLVRAATDPPPRLTQPPRTRLGLKHRRKAGALMRFAISSVSNPADNHLDHGRAGMGEASGSPAEKCILHPRHTPTDTINAFSELLQYRLRPAEGGGGGGGDGSRS